VTGDPADIVAEREDALRSQLIGNSPRVTADEAARGVKAARDDLASGVGHGYGVGFGLIKNRGSVGSQDGITLVFAVTDGQREATIDVLMSGTRLATINAQEQDADRFLWENLYRVVGAIPRGADRYAGIVGTHPITLG
jgi:hypothetical protein